MFTTRAIALKSAAEILSRGSRYWGGVAHDSRSHWSPEDKSALFTLCGAGADIERSAKVLGREPPNLAHKASDSGLVLSSEWRSLITKRTSRRAPSPKRLSYPYVERRNAGTADLLTVNDLIPKTIPEWVRADICQNIMLAIFEGATTLAEVSRNKSANFFIKKYYREEFDRNLVSLGPVDGDDHRAYDEIAASISRASWGWEDIREHRSAYDTLGTFCMPDQFSAVYRAEIRTARKRHSDRAGKWLSLAETEEMLDREIV